MGEELVGTGEDSGRDAGGSGEFVGVFGGVDDV